MNPLLYSIIEQLTTRHKLIQEMRKDSRFRPDGKQNVRGIECDYVDVDFYMGRRKKPIGSLGLIEALDALANDVHRFEDFDIHDADRVVVRGF